MRTATLRNMLLLASLGLASSVASGAFPACSMHDTAQTKFQSARP